MRGETNGGDSIVDGKESSGIGKWKGRRDRGTGWQRLGFELNTTIDAIVWFPELGTES